MRKQSKAFNLFGNYEIFILYGLKNFSNLPKIGEIFKEISLENYKEDKIKYKFILNYLDLCKENSKDVEEFFCLDLEPYNNTFQKNIKHYTEKEYKLEKLEYYSKIDFNLNEERIVDIKKSIQNDIDKIKKEKELNMDEIEESNAFKITEISSFKVNLGCNLNILENNKDLINYSSKQKVDIKLDDINIEKIKTINDFSELISSSFSIIRILPIYLGNSFRYNEIEKQNFAAKVFMKLFSIYEEVKAHKYCLIRNQILDFIQSFESLIIKLKQANANFDKILPNFNFNNIYLNNQSFVDLPFVKVYFDKLVYDKWNESKDFDDSDKNQSDVLYLKKGLLLGYEDQLQKARYRKVNNESMSNLSDIDKVISTQNEEFEKKK